MLFIRIINREQEREIKELSSRNQELTAQLINKIKELGILVCAFAYHIDSVQHELGLVLDNTLEALDS